MEKCDCGKLAVWVYLPGFRDGGNPFLCEDCVSRGCECTQRHVAEDSYHPPLPQPDLPPDDLKEGKDWKWIEENKIWCYIDEAGREYPCCEYEYSEEGFEKE